MKILVGVTGSVATIKVGELLKGLRMRDPSAEIRLVTTHNARHFFDSNGLDAEAIFSDDSEWRDWKQKGDPVLHIELRKWADVMVIAPLSANSLAKIANGLCDNLLTSVVRAWDRKKRLIICPAMNTYMWENPLTSRHMSTVQEVYNAEVVMPKDQYELACGDVGPGAMASIPDIVSVIFR